MVFCVLLLIYMEEELLQRIEDLESRIIELEEQTDSEERLNEIEGELYSHSHELGVGETQSFDSHLKLGEGKFVNIGNTYRTGITIPIAQKYNIDNMILGAGPVTSTEIAASETGGKAGNSQLVLQHQPKGYSNWTFFYGNRPPIVLFKADSISGNKISVTNIDFETNELAGTVVKITSSRGLLEDSLEIVSNTKNEITLSNTTSASGPTCFVFNTIYLGSADYPWRRAYVSEGSGAGIRFGYGPTGEGSNGLLYMNSNGNLIWRNKSGSTSTIA